MSQTFGEDFQKLRLLNNNITHTSCLQKIRTASPKDNIFFFCHGRSTGIWGCQYRAGFSTHERHFIYREYEANSGHLFYKDNFHLLNDKKIFCLACDSNKFAKDVITAGARVYLGFNDIAFDRKDLLESGKWSQHVIDITKYNLRTCVFNSIVEAKRRNLSYSNFGTYLKLLIDKTNDKLILEYKNHSGRKYYHRSANNLQLIKEGIKVWGDAAIKFNE